MKNKIYSTLLLATFFCIGSGVSSCGSGTSTSAADDANTNGIHQNTRSGTITMQFENAAATSTSMSAMRSNATSSGTDAPSLYGMKIIAAYLVEDIDPDTQNNIGQTLMFYLNEDCEDDIMHCDLSAGTAEDGNPIDKIIGVDDYIDLTDPTTVNAQLNDQTQSVSVGNYQYVRMEFCKYNTENAPNVEWAFTGVPLRTFTRQTCTISSEKITPPLEIASESDAVTFVASYDPNGSISIGDAATGDDCTTDTDGMRVCFTIPEFVPSILVE